MKQRDLVRAGVLVLLLSSSQTNAQLGPSEFSKKLEGLKKDHQDEIKRVIEPVNDRYRQQLDTLLKRATFDGDLEAAVKIETELSKLQDGAEISFVGQWEYEEDGNTYRRIIRNGGGVELWRNGKQWMRNSTTPIWNGHSWKANGDKIDLFTDEGKRYFSWVLDGPDRVLQKDWRSGKTTTLVRAKEPWK